MMPRPSNRRRHPRSDVSWLVVVEAGKRRFLLQTVDISARGAKVRPRERLDIGTPAQLRFRPPAGTPFNGPALVWPTDCDGLALRFMGGIPDRLRRSVRLPASCAPPSDP